MCALQRADTALARVGAALPRADTALPSRGPVQPLAGPCAPSSGLVQPSPGRDQNSAVRRWNLQWLRPISWYGKRKATDAAMALHDTLIVGGGPSGLTAALHLAWHQRKVLVIDRVTGPLFFTLEQLWNVPGMPGATGAEIQKRLKRQAEEMGAVVQRGSVVKAEGQEEDFL